MYRIAPRGASISGMHSIGLQSASMMRRFSTVAFLVSAWLVGLSIQMDWFSRRWDPSLESLLEFATERAWDRYAMSLRLWVTPILTILLMLGMRTLLRGVAARLLGVSRKQSPYRGPDNWIYAVFALTALGALGIYVAPFLLFLLFALGQGRLMRRLMSARAATERPAFAAAHGNLMALFFASGFAALIYQVVWQRALFQSFGVNIESVTVIVAVFMFGLGLGSLLGGLLSRRFPGHLLQLFVVCEVAIGLFGLVSLPLIKQVSSMTLEGSLPLVTATTFGLLCLPTAMMGATLPILVTYLHGSYRNVGSSLALLYFVNTLGSALASFICVNLLFIYLGLPGATHVAVCFNLGVAYFAYRLIGEGRAPLPAPPQVDAQPEAEAPPSGKPRRERYGWILFVAFAVGFLSLSIEILWVRLLSFATGGRPSVFGNLLGFYLVGIAVGSYLSKRPCERGRQGLPRTMALLLLGSAALFYGVVPAVAQLMTWIGVAAVPLFYLGAGVVALLTGAILPMLSHFAITRPDAVGLQVSGIYFANILGATAGPLLTGFYLLDWWSMERNVATFSLATLLLGLVLWAVSRQFTPLSTRWAVGALAAGSVAFALFPACYGRVMEKLYFKLDYGSRSAFGRLVQNRSGIVGTIPQADGEVIVTGGGVYDGSFNVDLARNSNKIARAYFVAALHPEPRRILEIGLSTGSWARVLLNHEAVEELDSIEINPGYLELIRGHDEQRTLLEDPRAEVIVDDGRRWMRRHPHERYDVIVMNTTFYWRSQINNLLSREFFEMARARLAPGGVFYFNTTSSSNAYFTAASIFPYVVQFQSFLACSDRPFSEDSEAKLARLARFRYRGRPVMEYDGGRWQPLIRDLAATDTSNRKRQLLELGSMAQIITDDNLASEFKTGRRTYASERAWARLLPLWWGGADTAPAAGKAHEIPKKP